MRTRWLLRFGVVLGAVIMLTGAEGLDPGELHCEEAAKHLADCCQQPVDRLYSCTAGRGCDSGRPSLDDPRATVVRDTSCESLIAQGACQQPPMTSPRGPYDLAVGDLAHPHDLSAPDLAGRDLSSPDSAASDGASANDGGDM